MPFVFITRFNPDGAFFQCPPLRRARSYCLNTFLPQPRCGAISGRSLLLPIQPSASYTPGLGYDATSAGRTTVSYNYRRRYNLAFKSGPIVSRSPGPGRGRSTFQGVERKRGGRVACYRKSFFFLLYVKWKRDRCIGLF